MSIKKAYTAETGHRKQHTSISSCSYNTPLNEIGNSSDKWKVEITIHGTTTEGKGWIIEKKYSDITLTSSPRGFRAFAIAGIPLHSGELTISVALVSDCQTATPTHSCNSNNNWRVEFFGSKIIPTPSVGIDLNNNVTIHIGNISITGHKAGC